METNTMTEAQMEQAADRMVWHRLATDSAYKYAEDAESQAHRENEITEQVWHELVAKHGDPS
jgi:hypothetical protein